jgi:hypothetical protein
LLILAPLSRPVSLSTENACFVKGLSAAACAFVPARIARSRGVWVQSWVHGRASQTRSRGGDVSKRAEPIFSASIEGYYWVNLVRIKRLNVGYDTQSNRSLEACIL